MDTIAEGVRTGRTSAELKQAILDNLYFLQGRIPELATTNDWYMAVSYAVRDRMLNDWIQAFGGKRGIRTRIVSYLSAEFLIGPQLGNNLVNTAAASLATVIAFRLLGESELGLAIATGAAAFFILVFSEITPKVIGASYPERIAFPAAYVLAPMLRLFYPLVWLH